MKVKVIKTIEVEIEGDTYRLSEHEARQMMLELSEALEELKIRR